MAVYTLDIWDNNAKAVTPGVSLSPSGAMFHSDSPIPVPDIGGTVDVNGDKWKVNRRTFSYGFADPTTKSYEPAVKVDLYCSKVP